MRFCSCLRPFTPNKSPLRFLLRFKRKYTLYTITDISNDPWEERKTLSILHACTYIDAETILLLSLPDNRIIIILWRETTHAIRAYSQSLAVYQAHILISSVTIAFQLTEIQRADAYVPKFTSLGFFHNLVAYIKYNKNNLVK